METVNFKQSINVDTETVHDASNLRALFEDMVQVYLSSSLFLLDGSQEDRVFDIQRMREVLDTMRDQQVILQNTPTATPN